MIELRESNEKEFYSDFDEKKYDIFIDGDICEDAYASFEEESFDYWSFQQIISLKLSNQKLQDFPKLNQIVFFNLFDFYNFDHDLSISFASLENDSSKSVVAIELSLQPNLETWKENFSFTDYRNVFKEVWKENKFNSEVKHNDPTEVTFISIKFFEPNSDKTIDEYLNPYKKVLETNHNEILNYLRIRFDKAVLTSFNFPENIKVIWGPAGLRYGSDALGGFLYMKTIRPVAGAEGDKMKVTVNGMMKAASVNCGLNMRSWSRARDLSKFFFSD